MAFNIVAGVNNAAYGSVTGSGSYEENDQVTLEVTANSGYRFVSWDDSNTDNPRVFQATEDVTLVATLEAIPEYTVTVNINNDNLGSVTGAGTYQENASVTVTAAPVAHCAFFRFVIDNTDITTNPYTFTVTDNVLISTEFITLNWYTITVTSDNTDLGSVSGSGDYDEGDTVTLTAVPETDCRFTGWSDGNIENPRTFQASASLNLTAYFEAIDYKTFSLTINDDTKGSVTGGSANRYEAGTQIELTAVPESGCKFVCWEINGEDIEYDNPLLFDVDDDTTIEAQFADIEYYTVNIFSTDADYGSVTIVSDIPPVNGKYQEGSELTVTAVPSLTGKFLSWGDNFSKVPERTIYVDGNIFLRANFCSAEGPLLVSINTFKKVWASIKNFFSSSTGASKIGAPANNALGATTLADVVNSVGQANGLAQLNADGKVDISSLGGSGNEGLDVDITGNAATATSAGSADVATKIGTTTVGSSTEPIYINAGTPTACSGSLDVDITGNAATATTASKLSNTTQIGNGSTPVYINASGVPTACATFASASIAANDSTKTPTGWFRIFGLTSGYENGIIIVGGAGYGAASPCYAILSFSISNNRPNISLISSGNTTTGAGGSTTKIRITCSTSARYIEAYNNPTEQTRNQVFRIFTNISGVTGYNITAGSSPNGEELNYTATVDINKNVEPCLHTTDTAIGSTSLPIYIDANGIAQTCSSYQGSVPVYYVQGPSTDTTAGTWTGSITGLTAYYNGLTILYVPAVAGASATTLNINNLGAKTCYFTNTSALTTHYSVGTPILFTYRDNAWRRADYDSNTTYSAMSVSEGTTGTATTSRTMRADYLKQIIAALPSASCTGNAATATTATNATKIKSTTEANANWYSVLGVLNTATSGTNNDTYRAVGNNISFRNEANAATAYSRLLLGNATASTSSASAARAGLLCLYGTNKGYANLIGPNITGGINVYMPSIGGYIPVSSDNTVRNIVKVSALPSSPNANTLYIVG